MSLEKYGTSTVFGSLPPTQFSRLFLQYSYRQMALESCTTVFTDAWVIDLLYLSLKVSNWLNWLAFKCA